MESVEKANESATPIPAVQAPIKRPCRNIDGCFDASCAFQHSDERIPVCTRGGSCDDKLCWFLHPPCELEICLAQVCGNPKVRSVLVSVGKARTLHSQKIQSLLAKRGQLVSSPLDSATAEQLLAHSNQEDMEAKTCRELVGQRDSFDSSLLTSLQFLISTSSAGFTPSPEANKRSKSCAFQITRELWRLQAALPALALRGEIEKNILTHNFLVVQGATGSGKSTQLPAYLAEMPQFQGLKIICTQPRKLAATSLASRVAEEWAAGSLHPGAKDVGGTVGYRVGAIKKSRPYTQIEYWTEGTFMAQLLGGKLDMSRVGVVVLDEAHERSIALDVIVGVLKSRHVAAWPHLKIVITSATLDTALFSNYFDRCPILSIPGRMYPVGIVYRPVGDKDAEEDADSGTVMNAVNIAWKIHTNNSIADGDILCFLTGQDEVDKAVENFTALLILHSETALPAAAFALYGKQQPEEQEVVFKALPHKRKVVFSTDVAETSITIDGICFVVDSGLTKESVYDVRRNVTLLEVRQISKSSADQRKGRAGRTRPGTCYRLYSEEDYFQMRVSQVAEILSNSLVLTVASLAARRIDAVAFPWIEKPDPVALTSAKRDLTLMGAFVDTPAVLTTSTPGVAESTAPPFAQLTAIGELINKLQIDPQLALMVYRGCERGLGEVAVVLAALFTVSSNVFWRGGTLQEKSAAKVAHRSLKCADGDAVTLYFLYCEYIKASEAISVTEPAPEPVPAPVAEPATSDHGGGKTDTAMVEFCRDEDTGLAALSLTADQPGTAPVLPPNSSDDVGAALGDEREERAIRVKTNRAGAKLWCKDHFVNGKALGIAQSMMREITKELKFLPIWTSECQDAHILSSEAERADLSWQICKLVACSFFLNAAVRVADRCEYSVVKNETTTIAWLHPGSVLSQLKEQEAPLPSWVVFQTLFQSSRPFINTLTPVDEEWIAECAPQFYAEALEKIEKVHTEYFAVSVERSVARVMFGKRLEEMPTVESELASQDLKCSLQFSYETNEVVVWCDASVAESINDIIVGMVESAEEQIAEKQREWEERQAEWEERQEQYREREAEKADRLEQRESNQRVWQAEKTQRKESNDRDWKAKTEARAAEKAERTRNQQQDREAKTRERSRQQQDWEAKKAEKQRDWATGAPARAAKQDEWQTRQAENTKRKEEHDQNQRAWQAGAAQRAENDKVHAAQREQQQREWEASKPEREERHRQNQERFAERVSNWVEKGCTVTIGAGGRGLHVDSGKSYGKHWSEMRMEDFD